MRYFLSRPKFRSKSNSRLLKSQYRKYNPFNSPDDYDSLVDRMFLTLHQDQKILEPTQTYNVKNNNELLIPEMLSFIFLDEEMK